MPGYVRRRLINKERKKAGLEPIPDNKWTKGFGNLYYI